MREALQEICTPPLSQNKEVLTLEGYINKEKRGVFLLPRGCIHPPKVFPLDNQYTQNLNKNVFILNLIHWGCMGDRHIILPGGVDTLPFAHTWILKRNIWIVVD